MHLTPKTNPAYILLRRDGAAFGPFSSLRDVASRLSGILVLQVGTAHDVRIRTTDEAGYPVSRMVPAAEFILVDRENRVVDPDLLRAAHSELLTERRDAGKPVFAFRQSPVPGTGKPDRHAEVRQRDGWRERRDAVASRDPDQPVRLRASRTGKESRNFPPDYFVPRRAERSWKRHRRTQWLSPG